MKKGALRRGALIVHIWLFSAVLCTIIFCCCAKKSPDMRYEAEKALYEARKLRSELSQQWITAGTEFLDNTLKAYRNIVASYANQMHGVEGLEVIVLSAQMELAEITFQAMMLPEARDEFEKAFDLAVNVPEARVTALYSAAYISEQIEEYQRALKLYKRFYEMYLKERETRRLARTNTQYFITPLKIAELSLYVGSEEEEKKRLEEAEVFYSDIIRNEGDPILLKAVRYNLLATYLHGKRWESALALLRELLTLYTEEDDKGALLFLEAKIYQEGLDETEKAFRLYKSIHEDHPGLPQAPNALLAAAALAKKLRRVNESKNLYETVLSEYRSTTGVASEAEWQLAIIEEERGNWREASLKYKLIMREYPTTIQGMEAPLRIAQKYKRDNEPVAAEAAYQRAIESYEKLLSPQYSPTTKILAEEYIVRTYVEMERWQKAIDLLLALPDRYPGYKRFQMNFLTAASILEEKMEDKEAAVNLLERCIERYPETEAASEAANQIRRLGGTQ